MLVDIVEIQLHRGYYFYLYFAYNRQRKAYFCTSAGHYYLLWSKLIAWAGRRFYFISILFITILSYYPLSRNYCQRCIKNNWDPKFQMPSEILIQIIMTLCYIYYFIKSKPSCLLLWSKDLKSIIYSRSRMYESYFGRPTGKKKCTRVIFL